MSRLKLMAYDLNIGNWEEQIPIETSKATRSWMTKFSYWCTPMVVANQYGWNIICPREITASWNGGQGIEDVSVEGGGRFALAHFGFGVLTFRIPYLFRTPRGWDLHVRGPINDPVDGISALEGLVETDMATETFTMNWKFTRPGSVTFSKGSVVCTVLPVERGQLQRFNFKIAPITSNEKLWQGLEAWTASRSSWNDDPNRPDRKHGDYVKRINERSLNLAEPVVSK